MEENIELTKEKNRHEEKSQENLLKGVALGATIAAGGYAIKKVIDNNCPSDKDVEEAIKAVKTLLE